MNNLKGHIPHFNNIEEVFDFFEYEKNINKYNLTIGFLIFLSIIGGGLLFFNIILVILKLSEHQGSWLNIFTYFLISMITIIGIFSGEKIFYSTGNFCKKSLIIDEHNLRNILEVFHFKDKKNKDSLITQFQKKEPLFQIQFLMYLESIKKEQRYHADIENIEETQLNIDNFYDKTNKPREPFNFMDK